MVIDVQLSLEDVPFEPLSNYPAQSIEDALKTETIDTTTEIVSVENTSGLCTVELVVDGEFKTMEIPLEIPAEIFIDEFGKVNREKHSET